MLRTVITAWAFGLSKWTDWKVPVFQEGHINVVKPDVNQLPFTLDEQECVHLAGKKHITTLE